MIHDAAHDPELHVSVSYNLRTEELWNNIHEILAIRHVDQDISDLIDCHCVQLSHPMDRTIVDIHPGHACPEHPEEQGIEGVCIVIHD